MGYFTGPHHFDAFIDLALTKYSPWPTILHSKCNIDKHDEYMVAVKNLELQIQEIDAGDQETHMRTIK